MSDFPDNVHVYANPDKLAAALADRFVNCAQTAITERGTFHVALAGGTTPKAAYALLAQEPRRTAVNWNDVFVFFGDERCVPPTDEASNYRMAMDTFLHAVNIPGHNVHRMRGEDEPAAAARAYSQLLREDLGEPPRFDLIMLGMGPDGHTASLFPGTDPLTDDAQLVRAPYVETAAMSRLTITPRVINAARDVAIAAEGQAKAAILAAVLRGVHDPTTYPIQIVAPLEGRLDWLVDAAAASALT
ncbi:MAG TPA: 6-phosphogluconolactonase [Candidatus Baltobacteraceae bacterium]